MISSKYHNIFNFKLVFSDFPKWKYITDKSITGITSIKSSERNKREKISQKKLLIAKSASKILEKISTVKFVGVTGSLAMMNASKNSDIDLMIITKKGTLWTTRLICYMAIWLNGYKIRNPKNKLEKDMLCINLWLDETDLAWDKKDRNIYTAHEIAQVMPLVNIDNTYERFLYLNKWILNYWPYSIKIENLKLIKNYKLKIKNFNLVEQLAFKAQYLYMKKKITREIITPTRAIFHPNDWGQVVMEKLKM